MVDFFSMEKKITDYLKKDLPRKDEVLEIRKILLSCKLEEDLKWGHLCYGVDGKNIVIIQPFKSYLAVLFFKGMLIKDPKKLLEKTGENTRVGRQMLFDDLKDVKKKSADLKSLVKEAMEIEKAGEKVPKDTKIAVPPELRNAFKASPKLKTAFEALTPGRKRAFVIFISSAKQEATRVARVKKCAPMILAGKGLNE